MIVCYSLFRITLIISMCFALLGFIVYSNYMPSSILDPVLKLANIQILFDLCKILGTRC